MQYRAVKCFEPPWHTHCSKIRATGSSRRKAFTGGFENENQAAYPLPLRKPVMEPGLEYSLVTDDTAMLVVHDDVLENKVKGEKS